MTIDFQWAVGKLWFPPKGSC